MVLPREANPFLFFITQTGYEKIDLPILYIIGKLVGLTGELRRLRGALCHLAYTSAEFLDRHLGFRYGFQQRGFNHSSVYGL